MGKTIYKEMHNSILFFLLEKPGTDDPRIVEIIYYLYHLLNAEEPYNANQNNKELINWHAISSEQLDSMFSTTRRVDKLFSFLERFKLYVELQKTNPDDEGIKKGLIFSYGRLGDFFRTAMQLEKALSYYEKTKKLIEELYKGDANNEELKCNLAISNSRIGGIFLITGQLDKALVCFQKGIVLFEELNRTNRGEIRLLEGLGRSYFDLGVYYFLQNSKKNGKYYVQKNIKIAKKLYKATKSLKYKEWLDYIKKEYGIG